LPPGVVTPIEPWKSCLLWHQQPPSAVASSEAVRKYRLVADLNDAPADVVGVVAGGANRHFTPRVALRRIVDVASGSRSRRTPCRRRSARSLSRPAVVARWCSQATAPRCSAGTDSRSRSSRRTLCLGSEGRPRRPIRDVTSNSPRRTPLMLPSGAERRDARRAVVAASTELPSVTRIAAERKSPGLHSVIGCPLRQIDRHAGRPDGRVRTASVERRLSRPW